MDVSLSEQDRDDIAGALARWANWVETGNVLVSARDGARAKKVFRRLGPDQAKLALRLRGLRERVLMGEGTP